MRCRNGGESQYLVISGRNKEKGRVLRIPTHISGANRQRCGGTSPKQPKSIGEYPRCIIRIIYLQRNYYLHISHTVTCGSDKHALCASNKCDLFEANSCCMNFTVNTDYLMQMLDINPSGGLLYNLLEVDTCQEIKLTCSILMIIKTINNSKVK